MTWSEYVEHVKEHIKNGEVIDIQPGIIGELVGSSEKNEARTSAVVKG